jgi:hypothetical protein
MLKPFNNPYVTQPTAPAAPAQPGVVGVENLDAEQLEQLLAQSQGMDPATRSALEQRLAQAQQQRNFQSRTTIQTPGGVVPAYGSMLAGMVQRGRAKKEAKELESKLKTANEAQTNARRELGGYVANEKTSIGDALRAAVASGDQRLIKAAEQRQARADRTTDIERADRYRTEDQTYRRERDEVTDRRATVRDELDANFRNAQLGLTAAGIASAAQDRAAAREERAIRAAEKVEQKAAGVRKEQNMVNSGIALVDEANSILTGDEAPHSNIVSRAVRGTWSALGGSTEGTRSNSRLSAIGSLLVQAAPKLGGVMSDRDVVLYQEAAGKLSDTSIPNADKLAALETLKGVMGRNKEFFDSEVMRRSLGGAGRVPTYNPATGRVE